MADPSLTELDAPERDGTAQSQRARPELVPGAVGIDERNAGDLVAFARRFASNLLWYDEANRPAGWWARPESAVQEPPREGEPGRDGSAFFDGIGPSPDGPAEALGYDEAGSILDSPPVLARSLAPPIARPHMALLLTAIRLMRHGQDALNGLVERHLQFHLGDVLRLSPRRPVPDRAFVLFELASGVPAAEAPAGLKLLAGRDSKRHDRIYRLDEGLIVNRARVGALASTFVDRQVVGLEGARRAIVGTDEEQFLFLVSLALGDPRPGDPLPPLLGKKPDIALLNAVRTFIAFTRSNLFLELFELRAMLARKALRSNEAADWKGINSTLQAAGRAARGDASWKLVTANPADFAGNLELALGGKPDLGGLTEVASVEDLALHLDRADVRTAIKAKLFMSVDQFSSMIGLKRAIDSDWAVINGYLELAGRAKRGKPDWVLKPKDQAAFASNLKAAIGPVDYSAAGPAAAGVGDPDSYLARLREIEAWFFLTAEEADRLVSAFGADEGTAAGALRWNDAYQLLAKAHSAHVRAMEAAALGQLRLHPPEGHDGKEAEVEAALGAARGAVSERLEALGRYVAGEDAQFVRDLFGSAGPDAVADWDRADRILAEARRRRLGLPEPVAAKDHWRSLWAYADARTAAPAEGQPWRCFGGMPKDAGPAHGPADIGWAIASPVLVLSTGRRKVVLTLGFRHDDGGPLLAPVDDHGDSPAKIPFSLSLSGAKGWIEPLDVAFSEVDYAKAGKIEPLDPGTSLAGLQISFTLDETMPAITSPAPGDDFGESSWPVLRLLLRPVWDPEAGRFDTAYERFRSLKLERAHVLTLVGNYALDGAPGLWPLDAETETGVANAKKPFEPFGPTPSTGSELALSHPDLLHKKLLGVGLSFSWLGGPPSLAGQYRNYPDKVFTAQLSLVDGGVRTTALGGPRPLFDGDDTTLPTRIDAPVQGAARPDPVIAPLEPEVRSWRRYLILQLSGSDFGHHQYPALVASKSIQIANAIKAGSAKPEDAVAPPWTPKLKRISADFSAVAEVRLGLYDRGNAIDRLFHVHPFGIEEARAPGAEGWPLLPDYDEEGALYLGLLDVEAPQSLCLLFAGAEGGGAEEHAGALKWSYLDADGWAEFAEPPADSTGGLVKRGIVRFELPAAAPDSRMPSGFYWLRASMATGAANACDMIDVHAQAGSASFVDADAPPEHYDAPLPAKTIRAFADPAAGIARVIQPYPSSGGCPGEGPEGFRTRVAERLRHKGRAVTLWDYERLVLDRFPEVHKVKCLAAGLEEGGPGMVRLVVIPDIRGRAYRDPFAPRAPARLLDEIATFLEPLSPPTARIEVRHAKFVQVRVRLGVRFRPGGDEAFDKARLAGQLNRCLAPWAFDDGSDIAIGQRIDATSIVALVDALPFVDFVGTCRLFSSEDGGATFRLGADGGDRVEAGGKDEVLTPATRHEIDVIGEDLFEESEFTGIGYMKIELDFVVH